tara:strand:+ start:184 stop:423 length:240 start_codon:yes stop_codon:yes gene_type:complete
MPQIGWSEILVIVILAILIIGPKDFPIILRKIGNWIGSVKKYFNEIQKDVSNIEDSVEKEFSINDDYLKKDNNNKKNER